MKVQFLIGRAGSGKTRTCLEDIHRHLEQSPHGPPLIFLVPEQATFQMERALLTLGSIRATHRAHVMSFQRLAVRLVEGQAGMALPRLGSLGKLMTLTALLQERRHDLKLFQQSSRQPGFAGRLADALKELRAWRIRPATLERLARELPDTLGDKLHDLSLIYSDFESYTEGRFADPDRFLDEAAEGIPATPWLREAKVWVDGFAGLTGQEFHMLRALWRTAAMTTVALCLDGAELLAPPGDTDLFAPTRATYDRLIRMAREDGVQLLPPRTLRTTPPPRFRHSPALAHVERHLFGETISAPMAEHETCGDPAGSHVPESTPITLVAAADPVTEVNAVAREMLRLCRERGWRFRDMSVITRDLHLYEPLIASVFTEHGIPYFIDRRRPLAHHPLVELVRSALEVYTSGWAPEPVFRCLRTDLIPALRDDVDRLENWALAHGARGEIWFDGLSTSAEPVGGPWDATSAATAEHSLPAASDRLATPEHQAGDADHDFDTLRTRLLTPLIRLTRRLEEARRAQDVVDALWGLLEDIDAGPTLARWAEEAQAAGRWEEAREHGGAWDGIVQLLEEMARALGRLALNPAACLPILEAGLEGLSLGVIPPTLDQVLIGTPERSRQPNIRAAFILGAEEGSFPRPPQEDAFFTDREREGLADRLELGPTSKTRLFHEQYFTYITLTRSSHYLWVSYATADQDGKALAPSPVFGRLMRLFPGLHIRVEPAEAADDAASVARIAHEDHLIATLVHRLHRQREGEPPSTLWWSLYNWTVGQRELRERALPILAALDDRNDPGTLPPALARHLYGQPFHASPSQLESFAACPFQHFAAHGLKLAEPVRPELDRAEVGTFLHGVLRLFVERLAKAGIPWAALSDEEALRWAETCTAELLPRLRHKLSLRSPRHRFALHMLQDDVRRAVLRLTAQARRSAFHPVATELPFGRHEREGPSLPPLALKLPDGTDALLRGRIDRVDVATDSSGKRWLRIIDYKSRALNFAPGRFIHGLSLQLPLYMAALWEHSGHVPSRVPDTTGHHPGSSSTPSAESGTGDIGLAGFLYFPVREGRETGPRPEGEETDPSLSDHAGRLKMRGLLLANVSVLSLMDTQLRPGGGTSPVIPAGLNANGTIHGQSQAVDEDRWSALIRFARQKATQLVTEILAGRIAIRPFRLGQETPCGFCPYRAVCRFDPALGGEGYRHLVRWAPKQAWSLILDEEGGAEG